MPAKQKKEQKKRPAEETEGAAAAATPAKKKKTGKSPQTKPQQSPKIPPQEPAPPTKPAPAQGGKKGKKGGNKQPNQQQNAQKQQKQQKQQNGGNQQKKKAATPAGLSAQAKVPTKFQTKLLINGKWVDAVSGKTFATINPATGATICQVAEGDKADIDKAVAAAKAALPAWKKVAPREKGVLLFKLAELMEKHREELATLESLDNGKPRAEAYTVDMNLAINTIRYYAGFADKIHGTQIPIDPPNFAVTKREPVGVVGQIIPWNFPICMAAWKLGPALCCGNVVVLKPAENTPLTALRIGELCMEAGFPAGVVNIVNGYGATAGKALAEHKDIDKVAFTGSTRVGKMIGAIAGGALKRCSLELGGKSPLYICEDADLDAAVETAHLGLFLNQGQCCCASSRIYVHESIYDEFAKRCVAKAQQRSLGDPMAGSTTQGPQISQVQFDTIMKYIKSGKDQGAKLATGGERFGDKGFFIKPTVFTNVKDDMTIAKEEIFGPVMSLLKFKNLEEAIQRGNKTNYGLAAGVFSKSIKNAMNVANNILAGTVWINTYDVLHEACPFGGFKESGIGRELSEYALDHYTEVKCIVINTSV
eukprot:TRINITY_DN2491_c0_g1_i1.p1 TRINITY_DN2491_c0_g1~~TRINITY_DN2491_c0_g1_i1.p1  ORF type:complete len:592 (-),score=144.56 TRINITY_DN2491_c0_g1_i1:295-2070(-)